MYIDADLAALPHGHQGAVGGRPAGPIVEVRRGGALCPFGVRGEVAAARDRRGREVERHGAGVLGDAVATGHLEAACGPGTRPLAAALADPAKRRQRDVARLGAEVAHHVDDEVGAGDGVKANLPTAADLDDRSVGHDLTRREVERRGARQLRPVRIGHEPALLGRLDHGHVHHHGCDGDGDPILPGQDQTARLPLPQLAAAAGVEPAKRRHGVEGGGRRTGRKGAALGGLTVASSNLNDAPHCCEARCSGGEHGDASRVRQTGHLVPLLMVWFHLLQRLCHQRLPSDRHDFSRLGRPRAVRAGCTPPSGATRCMRRVQSRQDHQEEDHQEEDQARRPAPTDLGRPRRPRPAPGLRRPAAGARRSPGRTHPAHLHTWSRWPTTIRSTTRPSVAPYNKHPGPS